MRQILKSVGAGVFAGFLVSSTVVHANRDIGRGLWTRRTGCAAIKSGQRCAWF